MTLYDPTKEESIRWGHHMKALIEVFDGSGDDDEIEAVMKEIAPEDQDGVILTLAMLSTVLIHEVAHTHEAPSNQVIRITFEQFDAMLGNLHE